MSEAIQANLDAAKEAVAESRNASAVEELALAIKIGQEFDFDPDKLGKARQIYRSLLEGVFGADDLDFVERALAFRDHARVAIPNNLADWPSVIPIVRARAALEGSNAAHLKEMLAL